MSPPERNDGRADPNTPAAVDRRRAGQGARAGSHKRTRWRRSGSAKSSVAASHVGRPRPCEADEGASRSDLPATPGRSVTSVQPLAQRLRLRPAEWQAYFLSGIIAEGGKGLRAMAANPPGCGPSQGELPRVALARRAPDPG